MKKQNLRTLCCEAATKTSYTQDGPKRVKISVFVIEISQQKALDNFEKKLRSPSRASGHQGSRIDVNIAQNDQGSRIGVEFALEMFILRDLFDAHSSSSNPRRSFK